MSTIETVIKGQITTIFDFLRGSMPVTDYDLILLFLVLKKEGYLSDLDTSISSDFYSQINKRLISDGTSKGEFLQLVLEAFSESIRNLNPIFLQKLIVHLNMLDNEDSSNNFPELFETLLITIARTLGRYGSGLGQPNELTKLILSIANLPEKGIVYNPFAGLGSFGIYLNSERYIGQELSHRTWALANLRIFAHNKPLFILKENSIENWNPWNLKFDLIVANPPFNFRLQESIKSRFGELHFLESFFIAKAIEDLTPTGKVIVVVKGNFLYRGSEADKNIRKYLVDRDLLEIVISFSGGVLNNTSIPINILVINKEKRERGIIWFINGDDFVVTKTGHFEKQIKNDELFNEIVNGVYSPVINRIGASEIANNDYNLLPRRYLPEYESPTISENAVSLSKIAYPIRLKKAEPLSLGTLVRIRDLKQDRLNYILSNDEVEKSLVPIPANAQRLNESALLLATKWNTLKPTFFKYSGEPIYLSSDIFALKVDESKVVIDYLVKELNADYILAQINRLRTGSVIPFISRNDLLTIEVELPSQEEQKAQIKGAKEALIEEKRKELDALKKLHGFENEIYEKNSFLRHSIAGPLKNVRDFFKNVKAIIEEQIVEELPDVMTYKLFKDSSFDLKSYLDIIARDLHIVSENVRRSGAVDYSISNATLEPIDIISFLQAFVAEVKSRANLIFTINFILDEEAFLDSEGNLTPIYINGNAELLQNLFNNLIENSEKHAFERIKRDSNIIEIYLSADTYGNKGLIVGYVNSGKSYPENFPKEMFIRNGSKSGEHAGDGFGGWYINEILKKHGASFTITSPQTDINMASSFNMFFPLTSN